MRGLILILVHSIAIIECENQVGVKVVQYPKDFNAQFEPDTKFHSRTRFESSNQKLHVKSPGILSQECKCPEKTDIVFLSVDNMKKNQRRSFPEGHMIEEPLYADEPKWILLRELNTNLIKQAEPDPFYFARGRKSAGNLILNSLDKEKKKSQYKAGDRQKHSDISDLFHEPFFISRGKKKSNSNDYYEGGSRVNENNRGIYLYDKRNEGGNDNGYSYKLSENDDDTEAPSRDRRDFFDQFLKESDPFYVTRG